MIASPSLNLGMRQPKTNPALRGAQNSKGRFIENSVCLCVIGYVPLLSCLLLGGGAIQGRLGS
jgi:hypothetical protein